MFIRCCSAAAGRPFRSTRRACRSRSHCAGPHSRTAQPQGRRSRRCARFFAPVGLPRLRIVEFRGVASAAMIYDRRPIIDHFRRIDDRCFLGLMEMRGMDEPYFFALLHERAHVAGESVRGG